MNKKRIGGVLAAVMVAILLISCSRRQAPFSQRMVADDTGQTTETGASVTPGATITPEGDPGQPPGDVGTPGDGDIPGDVGTPGDGDIPGDVGTPGDDPGEGNLEGAIPGPTEPTPSNKKLWIDTPWDIESAAFSVVKLETYDKEGNRIATGSGFCIFDDRFLVTARHVVVNMDHITATLDYGDTFEIRRVIEVDEDNDIAVCLIPAGIDLIPLTPAPEIPFRGERTVAIGSQFGVLNLATMGNFCGQWSSGEIERLLFTSPVASGSSGGPLFNSKGQVIGVVSGTYDGGQNLNLAVPIDVVYMLLEDELEE